jgi:serine/threonine-protein kinase
MIGQTVSHYRILSKLGKGGMGAVYVAEDTLLGRRVAVKSLAVASAPGQRHFRKRFLREAQAASVLNHPHIATIHDYGETEDGLPYIVMELVEGQSLSDLLRQGTLPLERAVEIAGEVAEALAEAHRHGIVHRDIKPSNVAISERGHVKVLDFGLAKRVGADDLSAEQGAGASATLTRDGVIVGTPSNLSPEQALGLPVDARSDIFSLGLLLYECLAGRPAFTGASIIEICAKIIRDDPPPPSHLNPLVTAELDRITSKALAKKADDRYQTAEELLEDLRSVRPLLAAERERSRAASLLIRSAARFRGRANLPRVPVRAGLLAGLLLIPLAFILLAAAGQPWKNRLGPHEPSPEAKRWYQAGVSALRDGSYFKARKTLEQAVKADGRFPLAHARLAEAWAAMDYDDRAANEMLRVTELMPDRSALSPTEVLYLQALTATVRRDYVRAAESYRELAGLLQDEEKTHAYFDLGRALERIEDVGGAIGAYEELTRRDGQYPPAFLRLGVLYGRRQDAAKAEAAFEKAEALYTAQSNYDGLVEVLYQRGYFLSNREMLTEASALLQRALELASATENKPHQIRVLLQLSRLDYVAGHAERAHRYGNEAIELARNEQLDNLALSGLLDIGNTFFVRGEYAEAERRFTQVLETARAARARRWEARASLSLGSLYVQQGKGGEALRYVEPALAFYEQGNFRRETSQALLLLGYARDQLGDYEAALRVYTQLLRLAEQADDMTQVAHARAATGLLLMNQERFPEALEHFGESYRLHQSLGLSPKAGYDLLNRGSLLWQLGRYDEAAAALAEATAVARRPQGGDKQLLAWAHLSGAQMALSRQRYREAISESRQAAEAAGGQVQDLSIHVASTIGLAQSRSGMTRAGRESCQKSLEAAAQSGSEQLVSDARLALAEAALANGGAREALELAAQAQEVFARSGRRHSEWRALLVAALASRRLGDGERGREYASRAQSLLTNLEQQWGAENYGSYLTRRDVREWRERLGESLSETVKRHNP